MSIDIQESGNLADSTTVELMAILTRNGRGAQAIVDQWKRLGSAVVWPIYLQGVISSAVLITQMDTEDPPPIEWRKHALFVVNFLSDSYLWQCGPVYPLGQNNPPKVLWLLVDINLHTFYWDYQS